MVTLGDTDFSFSQSHPPSEREVGSDRRLEIVVLFTSQDATAAAINCAAMLLRGLNGRISLLDMESVPHQLSLESPPVSGEFIKQRLLELANTSSVEVTGYVYFCRFPLEAVVSILKTGSLIVIGCRKRWWPTWEGKLAGRLRKAGYQVIVHES